MKVALGFEDKYAEAETVVPSARNEKLGSASRPRISRIREAAILFQRSRRAVDVVIDADLYTIGG